MKWLIYAINFSLISLEVLSAGAILAIAKRLGKETRAFVVWIASAAIMDVIKTLIIFDTDFKWVMTQLGGTTWMITFTSMAASAGILLPMVWRWHPYPWANWASCAVSGIALVGTLTARLSTNAGIALLHAALTLPFLLAIRADPLPLAKSARGHIAYGLVSCFAFSAIYYPFLAFFTNESITIAQVFWLFRCLFFSIGYAAFLRLAYVMRRMVYD